MTAAKRLEAIGLNDATVAALLKELEKNAMTKSDAEPTKDHLVWRHPAPDASPPMTDGGSSKVFETSAALAQSDAEPVYFHRYENTSRWIECSLYEYEAAKELKNTETRVLYTAPPRPDASAGLIEAAELLKQRADEMDGLFSPAYREAATFLRTRATDRSGE